MHVRASGRWEDPISTSVFFDRLVRFFLFRTEAKQEIPEGQSRDMPDELSSMKPNATTVLTIYAVGFLQGMAMVSFPASATVLKDVIGFTDAQYGLIFIPQIATTILSSLGGGSLVRRLGLSKLLVLALIATGLSQLGLGVAVQFLDSRSAFHLVLCSTAMFGLAFGTGAAPLNTYPGLLFPRRRDTALVALHTLLGIGLATGPLAMRTFTDAGAWIGYPAVLILLTVLLLAVFPFSRAPACSPHEEKDIGKAEITAHRNPMTASVFWVFAGIVILYAFAEGTFANWSIIYLREERGIALASASLALSGFWAMIAGGRLLVSLLLLKIKAEWIWLLLPLLMIIAFLLLPMARTAVGGIALFALAGLACSAFFPLTVGLVSRIFPESAALVSSLMIAALMLGVGIGSFVIGPLRSGLPLERLYLYSTFYPAGAFLLAVGIAAWRWRSADIRSRT